MLTLLDVSLYCEENHHQWEEEEDEEDCCYSCIHDADSSSINNDNNNNNNVEPQHKVLLPEDDDLFYWDHQQLSYLKSKESHLQQQLHNNVMSCHHRRAAVEWVLGVVSHYSFRAVTAVLAVNYLDRFVERFEEMEMEKKPWMIQLVAVSCLSIAAKVEETHVPLLLDLQIDGSSKYVFEPKTVQKMEILVLSTLEWKMNPVTPLSFLDYIARRLRSKSYISSEFVNRFECLLLCLLLDGRCRCYLPSVIATSIMVLVINGLDPCIGTEFQSQLLAILGINKEEVEKCGREIQELECNTHSGRNKRKIGLLAGSPDGVTGLSFSSEESWCLRVNSSVSSSPEIGTKKSRNGEA